MAQVSSPLMTLPRREAELSLRLRRPAIAAWLPVIIIIVGIMSLFHLATTSDLTTTGYSIQELRVQENDWKLRNEQLGLELARAKSLAAIEAEATGRMGMVRPKDVTYLRIVAAEPSRRLAGSSRGDGRAAQPPERPAPQTNPGLLEPFRASLSTWLALDALQGRQQRGQ